MSELCRRCKIGIDDDGDGNCAVCAHWTDEEVQRVNRARKPFVKIHPYDMAEMIELLDGAEFIEVYKHSSATIFKPGPAEWLIDGVRYIQDPTVPRTPGKHTIV